MKTLDEVIKAMEWCTDLDQSGCGACPYADNEHIECYKDDALHYLKEYQELTAKLVELNEPLTWQELQQMEGKPVWVEMVGFSLGGNAMSWKFWAIVSLCDDEIFRIVHDQFENMKVADEEQGVWNACAIWDMPKEDLGKTWQAYRKER